MASINNRKFFGKQGNVKRKRRPIDGINRNADGCVLLTVENKYKFTFIEPEVDIDQTIINLDNYATLARIPAFRFEGDDMIATVSYLLKFDEYEVFKPLLSTILDKVFIDWEEDYDLWKQDKERSQFILNHPEEDIFEMDIPELTELISEYYNLTNRNIVVNGENIEDYRLAILMEFGYEYIN